MPVKGKRPECFECYTYPDGGGVKHIPVRLHRTYIKLTKDGKTKWIGVGWYCPMCESTNHPY